jgi:hypothetical protein
VRDPGRGRQGRTARPRDPRPAHPDQQAGAYPRPRVRGLADAIIAAPVGEIGEMKQLIAELEQKPIPSDAPDLPPAN